MVSDSQKEISNYNDLLVKRFNLPNWYNNYTLHFWLTWLSRSNHIYQPMCYELVQVKMQTKYVMYLTYISVMKDMKFHGESGRIQ